MSEQHSASPDTRPMDPEAQRGLAASALRDVTLAARHFYGAESMAMSTPLATDGEHELRIKRPNNRDTETIGRGPEYQDAVHDSLAAMRSLEAVITKPLASIEMGSGKKVHFTALEHYTPRIAPGTEAYPVPKHLGSLVNGRLNEAAMTYRNTVEQDGWQQDIRSLIDTYVQDDPKGAELLEGLNIRSLSHLSPEQAVKFSVAFVQNVSKYDWSHVGKRGPADAATSMELIAQGIANRDNPNWAGNGVCRNIASNVKAVFESLKATQSDVSMLENTYTGFDGGLDGDGYQEKRRDSESQEAKEGHAWNTFVTIDKNGSATVTIVDATWALGKDSSEALDHFDQTSARMATPMVELFKQSEHKSETFEDISYFLSSLAQRNVKKLPFDERMDLVSYAASEYLKAASSLPEIPKDHKIPSGILSGVLRIRDRLDQQEIKTLFKIYETDPFEFTYTGNDQMLHVLKGYDQGNLRRDPKTAASKMIFPGALQELVGAAVGEQRLAELSQDSSFRTRMSFLK